MMPFSRAAFFCEMYGAGSLIKIKRAGQYGKVDTIRLMSYKDVKMKSLFDIKRPCNPGDQP
jgi:hypothetical protein